MSHEDVGEVSKIAIKLLHIRRRGVQKWNACTMLFALEGSKVHLFSDLLLVIFSHTRDHSIIWELWRVSNPEQHNYSCVEMVIRLKENLLTPCSLHWRREVTPCIYSLWIACTDILFLCWIILRTFKGCPNLLLHERVHKYRIILQYASRWSYWIYIYFQCF